MAGWRLEHSYTALPELFHTSAAPTPVREPRIIFFNRALAASLGLDVAALDGPAGAAILAGNALPDGARPIAQAYAGHQFGHFTTLGDGRAILLGEQVTPDGRRVDIQLKGPGPTRYSRRGDGRAALGPMLREYIISEAMHALGIPTTRSLAVVATGEPVYRERALQGAVLTRVAASHLRVGTMQWAAAHQDVEALRALAEYTRARHYPELDEPPSAAPLSAAPMAAAAATASARAADAPTAAGVASGGAASLRAPERSPDTFLALYEAIVERQAALIARWQLVGFIHGVMNTDNMALSGETIDYGPCAFMDAYDPATVFSSIDQGGRYAYGNQPVIAQWNLARLAEAMLPLIDPDLERGVARVTEVLERFMARYEQHWLDGMRAKLGLFTAEGDDRQLIDDLLAWMQRASADFTNTFRALMGNGGPRVIDAALWADPAFAAWRDRLAARRGRQAQGAEEVEALMRRSTPAVIPRNHKVEEALAAATDANDLSVLTRLLDVLATPFDHDRARDLRDFTEPGANQAYYRTFCGT